MNKSQNISKNSKKEKKTQELYNYCIKLIHIRPRTKREIMTRLEKRGTPPSKISLIIIELRHLGYIDDKRYAHEYVEYLIRKKPSGKIMIQKRMKMRGLSQNCIDLALATWDDALEKTLAWRVTEKKISQLSSKGPVSPDKIVRYLQSKGFSSGIINEIFEKLRFEAREEDEYISCK